MLKNLNSQIENLYKFLYEIKLKISNKIVGLGACSWHSIGSELLKLYRAGNKDVINFVDNVLLELYKKKYYHKENTTGHDVKYLHENENCVPAWANFKDYPLQALEYNKFCDTRFYGDNYDMFFNNDNAKIDLSFNELIIKLLSPSKEKYFNNREDNKNDSDKLDYELYVKWIYSQIVSFDNNRVKINIDYDKLLNKLDELEQTKIDKWQKTLIKFEVYMIINKSLKNKVNHIEINYDYSDDWFISDQKTNKINIDLLKTDWNFYRIGNILGQVFREYLCDKLKGMEKNKKSNIINDVKDLNNPFIGQNIISFTHCLKLLAAKTKKPSIIFGTLSPNATNKYDLIFVDAKEIKARFLEIKFTESGIHIFEDGERLCNSEISSLFNQIKEIEKEDPFLFFGMPGHLQTLKQDKKNDFFDRINKTLEFAAKHERSKSIDIICRVGRFFLFLGKFCFYSLVVLSVIPMLAFGVVKLAEYIKKNRKKKADILIEERKKLKATIAIDDKIEKLKEYIKRLEKIEPDKAKLSQEWIQKSSISKQDSFEL